jgi:hypothetical protein
MRTKTDCRRRREDVWLNACRGRTRTPLRAMSVLRKFEHCLNPRRRAGDSAPCLTSFPTTQDCRRRRKEAGLTSSPATRL